MGYFPNTLVSRGRGVHCRSNLFARQRAQTHLLVQGIPAAELSEVVVSFSFLERILGI